MMMFRFSLRQLLGLIAIGALAAVLLATAAGVFLFVLAAILTVVGIRDLTHWGRHRTGPADLLQLLGAAVVVLGVFLVNLVSVFIVWHSIRDLCVIVSTQRGL